MILNKNTLKKRREELKLSQREVSERSGVAIATISKLETGKRPLHLSEPVINLLRIYRYRIVLIDEITDQKYEI